MIKIAEIKLKGYVCERCKHKWIPRNQSQKPIICPKCKRLDWDRKRRS